MAGVDNDIDFLPLDVICLILLYLPVSSLLRFKSLSKSWLSFIESSDFVYKHFHFHQHDPQTDLILLTWPYLEDKPKTIENPPQASLFSVLRNPGRQLPLHLPLIQDPYQITCPKIAASSNGIICLHQGRAVCLWNPATKQCTNLPPLPLLSHHCIFGFGFDPKTGDYKVVTLNCLSDRFVSHIYSLSSDSWRNFEGPVLLDMYLLSTLKASYRDRFFCWLVITNLEPGTAVYTFDFSDEVFEAIPTPSSISVHALCILNENIACIGNLVSREPYYEIWMLSDYQVKESWTKLYSIDAFSNSIDWMTSFSNNGEFFLIMARWQLYIYDLLTQQVIDLPVQVGDSCYEVVMYRESMLSIKRENGAANQVTSLDCNRRMSMNQSIPGNSRWGDSDDHKTAMFRILLWLSVVSLLRFKSVCKSWNSLIKSSDFVTQHLFLHHRNHNQDNLSLILHSTNIMHSPMFEDLSHHCLNASGTCLLSSNKLELLDLPLNKSYYGLDIVTSVNGIICLSESNYGDMSYGEVYLWNPITKQFRDLYPKGASYGKFSFGFVFYAKTNNYKLVRFVGGYESDSVAHVYCLNTDSWKIIDAEILPTVHYIRSGLDAPYSDEIYCWLADVDDSSVILWFDFSNEVFGTMPLPDSIHKLSHPVLTVLMDKIVCISLGEKYYSDDTDDYWHCEIWMMNEYGVAESWVKLYTVGPFSKDWRFKMCYSKKNGDYMLLLKDGQLYEYDLVMQNTKRLPYQIQGPKDYQVLAYKESLVPIE